MSQRFSCSSGGPRRLLRGLLLALLFVHCGYALAQEGIDARLQRMDEMKTTQYSQFVVELKELQAAGGALTGSQREFLDYLLGWQEAYAGNYEAAISLLQEVADRTDDPTIRFRATVTIVNVLSIAKRYEEAFTGLARLLEQLPQISDKLARRQGLGVIALLYNQVGEYRLGESYAQQMIDEESGGKGACMGGQLRLDALYKSGAVQTLDPQFQQGVDTCVRMGELVFANLIRTNMADFLIRQKRFNEAIDLLSQHYSEVLKIRYPVLISAYNSLLAEANYQANNAGLARKYALSATENAVRNEFTAPLVNAYRLLYLVTKEDGDPKAALSFYEKYAEADKGYLDDVSARQIAYQRVLNEVTENKLKIAALNKENEVLRLQRELDSKAIENVRLYAALLIVVLGFLIFWAYKTKRSQLHFMMLSRRDGLTGIFNRPHFIELAKNALDNCRKMQQEVCLVLCDLDHFKSINDKHGHAGGDSLLRHAVIACQPHLRSADIFARIGGEEFCILLPGCSIEAARQRAEQLRAAVAAIDLSGMNVSASLGVTSSNDSGYELRELMAHADLALYKAKRLGRNRVVVYGETEQIASNAADNAQATQPREAGAA